MNSCSYQWDLLERFSFNRPAGTEKSALAAAMIRHEIEQAGGTPTEETFSFDTYQIEKASFRVLEPYEKTYPVTGIGFSGEIDDDFDFSYVERATAFDFEGVTGGAVLANVLDAGSYKNILHAPAACFLTVNGKFYDSPQTTDLQQIRLKKALLQMGQKPGFLIRTADAIELVQKDASRVHCTLKQHCVTRETSNVYTCIPGSVFPDEYIIFSAHYDSVPVGNGAYDNASGLSTVFQLYRYFLAHPPKRSMLFLWCGAEEYGLLGSRDFVTRHPALMPKVRTDINFDMTGPAIGYDGVSVMADESVCTYLRTFAEQKHRAFVVARGVASSDCNSFAAAGIPSFNFFRYGEADIHTKNDILFPLSPKKLARTTDFVRDFVLSCDCSGSWPLSSVIPEDIAVELSKTI